MKVIFQEVTHKSYFVTQSCEEADLSGGLLLKTATMSINKMNRVKKHGNITSVKGLANKFQFHCHVLTIPAKNI
jgi:hypothetical protein